MAQICRECPVIQLREADRPKYQEGWDNGLFLQAIQGLSGQMVGAVRGTTNGLTEARIEEIRVGEVKSWQQSKGFEEAEYLETHPELAKAVHDCELKIQLGECAMHSTRREE